MEGPTRELIASELDAMHNIVTNLIENKNGFREIKSFGFTEVEVLDGEIFSICDLEYKGKSYFLVLLESEEESGVFIRSGIVDNLEIILPLPLIIRMNNIVQ